jgi:hypothetical protein
VSLPIAARSSAFLRSFGDPVQRVWDYLLDPIYSSYPDSFLVHTYRLVQSIRDPFSFNVACVTELSIFDTPLFGSFIASYFGLTVHTNDARIHLQKRVIPRMPHVRWSATCLHVSSLFTSGF